MKTFNIFTFLFFILFSGSGCIKPKKNTNEAFKCNFDTSEDLSMWTKISSGEIIIEGDHAKLTAATSCFGIETTKLIPLTKGKSYSLKFKFKMNQPQSGPPGCVGYFLIWVIQGNDTPLFQSSNEAKDWTDMAYSFEAVSSAEAKIRFSCGTENGAYLDNLVLIEN